MRSAFCSQKDRSTHSCSALAPGRTHAAVGVMAHPVVRPATIETLRSSQRITSSVSNARRPTAWRVFCTDLMWQGDLPLSHGP
ncbi:MAG TPA: hypothetical protein QF708_05460 [Candidatus Poseidoniia archaeon]|nr:hypothetical protein [Candidatus Poseidoniia archaeon]